MPLTARPMKPDSTAQFLGHPAGFSTLFFTELWERFSYYGMRAILVLFLVGQVATGGMGLDEKTALAIYGLYTASVYIASMPGGWIADRLLGAQRSVFWGGSLIALGHAVLAFGQQLPVFLLGLLIIVLGTGLLKPNISALVGELHRGTPGRRDAAFTLFYLAINIGATAGPLAVAWLASQFGWHYGFGAAAIGMTAGLVYFLKSRSRLGDAGLLPPAALNGTRARDWTALWIFLAGLTAIVLLIWTGTISVSPIALQAGAIKVMAGIVALYFAWLLLFAGLTNAEKRRIVVLAVLILASTLFWAGYEQAGSSLTLFAEKYTDRLIGSYEFPAGWFQSVPAAWVLICAPLMAVLWTRLDRRGRDLSVITKFALGLLGMGLGFLLMAGAAKVLGPATGAAAAPWWLIGTYLLHTLGELALSPVGMSATTRLAPRRLVGQAMGLWFTSLAMGNLFASKLAGEISGATPEGIAAYFLKMFGWGALGALLLLITLPVLKRWAASSAADDQPSSGQ